MPNDIQGGIRDLTGSPAATAGGTATGAGAASPHQSFMTVAGQAIGVVLLAELAGAGPVAGRIVGVLILGLWLAFLVNNSDKLFGALQVTRT